jgi:outer membrane immunogenic protein
MKKVLIGALLACVATSAFAADLPTRKEAPAMPYTPPPIFSWTGFYVGANGVYGWGDVRGPNNGVFGSPSGGMGGITAGYNYQISQFVVGLEGDFDWGDISENKTLAGGDFSKYHVSDFATVRGRAGVAMDRALLYVTGGYAGAKSEPRSSTPPSRRRSPTVAGKAAMRSAPASNTHSPTIFRPRPNICSPRWARRITPWRTPFCRPAVASTFR